MDTWSWIGSTVAVVKAVANKLGVDPETLDGKEIFDHYKEISPPKVTSWKCYSKNITLASLKK